MNFMKMSLKKDKVQDININELKLEVHGTYKKDERITTNFEPINDEDVLSKAFEDKKLSNMEGQISYIEKDYNEYKLLSKKNSIGEIFIQRAGKMTIQILYDKELFDNFTKADEVLKYFLAVRRHRLDLAKSK